MHKKQANCFSVYVNREQRRGNECCCGYFSTSCCENNSIEVHIPTTAPRKRAAQHGNHQKGLMTMVLDVLTPLSDCRQESVEKMERTISGVSYMCWIDFHHGILGCGFFCARLISVSFFWVSTTARATTPHRSLYRLPRRGLPRPYRCIRANRLPRLQGYRTRATTIHINLWVQVGYLTCW